MRLDQVAAQTWNTKKSLEDVTNTIHDGISDEAELAARADGYVRELLFGRFPQAMPPSGASVLEIGSGVGWIMEAMARNLEVHRRPAQNITGLDIADNMIKYAHERMGNKKPFDFLLYDGVEIPLSDNSCDLVYSVAAMQHIPRPFLFNLFFEIKRILKSQRFAVMHVMSTDALPAQEKQHPWRLEVKNQISGANAHWHHFYTAKELQDVLTITGFQYVAVHDDGAGTLVCCVSNSSLSLPYDFDADQYLRLNPDVARAGDDAARHWLTHGHKEGRKWRGA
jgi:ubiquinone/menaquinone biosynthesis C-methylase UbiE